MPKKILILACTLMLGGCALPVPLQIASWAVDGLLFITTEKTMADHGVSLVVQRDCAMLRVITEGTLCRDDDSATVVAEAQSPGPGDAGVIVQAALQTADDAVTADDTGDDVAVRLASLETAAGGSVEPVLRVPHWQEAPVEDTQQNEAALAAARWQAIIDAPAFFDHPAEESIGIQSIPELKPEPARERTAEPTPGLAFEVPTGGDVLDVQHVDDRLHLGDVGHDPFLNAQDEITILGGAGDDALIGWSDSTRNPAPTQADARLRTRASHGRRRRHAPRLAGARGRGPPGRGARPRRVHDPQARDGPGG
jgi:hypothetical protein